MLSFRDVSAQRVSIQSIDQVLKYFSYYQRKHGRNHIAVRLSSLAEEVKLAIGTLQRALHDLADNDLIEIIKNHGNNAPKIYIFKGDFTKYEPMVHQADKDIDERAKELGSLRQQVEMYHDFVKRIQDVQYKEDGQATITVDVAPDGSVGIPLHKSNYFLKTPKTFNPGEWMTQ